MPEYTRFRGFVTEIQVRTVLQHAWAEIEHDIQYKSASAIPTDIRRRFMGLAGLLELADREFQAVQDADAEITKNAQANIATGNLDVEITPGALKAYLDRRLGPDGRMSNFSYEWNVRTLKHLGFHTLQQVEDCIDGYDDDAVSRAAVGGRSGQLTRFEHVLLAAMGNKYIDRHPFAAYEWFAPRRRELIERFESGGIPINDYDPTKDST